MARVTLAGADDTTLSGIDAVRRGYNPATPSPNTGIAGAGSPTSSVPAPTAAPPPPTTMSDPTFNEAELSRLWNEKARSYPGGGINGQSVMEFLADSPSVSRGVNLAGSNNTKLRLPDGRIIDLVYSSGDPTHARPQWLDVTNGGGSGAAGAGTPGHVFSDPATTEWETLLRKVVDQLSAPRPTGYTPAQLDLQQTQQIDPLERQRQAMHQQVLERAAAHGWGSGSGLIEKATQDVDRQFNQFETQTRAGVANNAIALEDQRNQLNDQRAVQALGIMGQIPALADSRLQLANQTLIPSNPYQLLSLQNQFQNSANQQSQYNTQQSQAFWTQLGSILANYFGQQ